MIGYEEITDLADGLFALGRKILSTDGFHKPIVFVFPHESRAPTIISMKTPSPPTVPMWKYVDAVVRILEGAAFIYIGEAWVSVTKEITPQTPHPREDPERQEALVLFVGHPSGATSRMSRFSKEGGRVTFGKDEACSDIIGGGFADIIPRRST